MKKVLFAGLLSIVALGMNAQNLLKNGKLENEVTATVSNPNKAIAGDWFILNGEPNNATSLTWEKTSDTEHPNVIKIDNTNAEKNIPWYRAYLGQRMTDGLEKGIYMLTFYAKAKEADTPVGVYIRQTNDTKNDEGKACATFLMRKGYNPDTQETSSGAQHNCVVKKADSWTKFVVYYDANRIVDSVTSIKSYPNLKVADTGDADILKDCFIAFVSGKKGAIVEISDITLEKK